MLLLLGIVFFHLNHDDQRDMFSIFQRHAKDGCVLVFASGPSYGVAINPMLNCPLQDDFYHASLDAGEYRELLENHGFGIVLHRVEDEHCGDHTVWVARYGE